MSDKPYKTTNIAGLFLFGMLLVCVDIVNVDLGGFKLKIAYIAFVFYILIFAFAFGVQVNRKNLAVAVTLLIAFLPSVLLTTAPLTSVAFYAGTIICLSIMMTFARMTMMIGEGAIDLLVRFYRFSIILTGVLVIARIQERGSFLFYEASYYAIALIPYLCITFNKIFEEGFKTALTDLGFIVAVIVMTTSVSLVLWAALSFAIVYLRSGQARLAHLVGILLVGILLLYAAYVFNARTKMIGEKIMEVYRDPTGYLDLLLFVAGNRLQRVLVAYEAFTTHPWVGVGLGALRNYATLNFTEDTFTLDGMTASDFNADTNATNIYMELGAEGGLIGLLGFVVVLVFVARQSGNTKLTKPLKIAFFVTMISLLIESSYLRTYVWALYGIIIGLAAAPARKIEEESEIVSNTRGGDELVSPGMST